MDNKCYFSDVQGSLYKYFKCYLLLNIQSHQRFSLYPFHLIMHLLIWLLRDANGKDSIK